MIKFVVANVSDFTSVGIDVTNERHSLDGTKAIKHIELLSTDELNAIRSNLAFSFYGDDSETNNINDLMQTDEWKTS
jgi:hypothetical protein